MITKIIFYTYVGFLLFLIIIGIDLARLSWDSGYFVLDAGAFSLVALPYSLIIFPIFGLLLFKHFSKFDSFLMLGFTYVVWELASQFTISGLLLNNVYQFSLWCISSSLIFIVVKPKVNFNHMFSIILFVVYVQHPLGYIDVHLINLENEIVWCLFIWYSFRDSTRIN